MDFRHQIVTCLFSMLRLSFETQKIKENYAIFYFITSYLFFYFRLKISLAAEEAQNSTHYPCSFLHSLNAFKREA